MSRTTAQIQQSISNDVLSRNPKVRLVEGSGPGDVLLTSVAQELHNEELQNDYLLTVTSLNGIESLLANDVLIEQYRVAFGLATTTAMLTKIRVDLEALAANYGITPTSTTYGSGVIRLYRNVAPTGDIVIPLDTQVSGVVDGNTINFKTTAQVTMYLIYADTYQAYDYNLNTVIWRIDVPIQAVVAGSSGNVAANVIVNGAPSGFAGCFNPIATLGGSDVESNSSLIRRARLAFEGRELATNAGLESFVLAQNGIEDCLVVDADDTLMVRDGGFGGMTDVYILGQSQDTVTENYTGDDLELVSGAIYKVILDQQPVLSVATVLKNGTAVSTNDYVLTMDTGDFKNSVRGQTYILFDNAVVSPTDTLTITYTYDAQPGVIQNTLGLSANKILNEDILVKAATEVVVDIGGTLVINNSYNKNTVRNNVVTNLTNAINGYLLEDSVYISDMTAIVEATEGVIRLDDSNGDVFTTFQKRSEPIGTTPHSITITKAEYASVDGSSFNNLGY